MEDSQGEGRELEELLAGRLGEEADKQRARGTAGGHASLKGVGEHLKDSLKGIIISCTEPVGHTPLSMTYLQLVINYLPFFSLDCYLLYGK